MPDEREARPDEAHEVKPEYQGEHTFFDDLRDEPETREAEAEAPPPTEGEIAAEGVGGVGGAVAGLALGSLAGPLGTLLGGIAGAVGGWWAGRAAAEAAAGVEPAADAAYRAHYEADAERPPDRGYDEVRPVYVLGHVAGAHPEYGERRFEEVEPELQRGWTPEQRARIGEWARVRRYAAEGFRRRRDERHERLGGTPRTMTPGEAARERLHEDDGFF